MKLKEYATKNDVRKIVGEVLSTRKLRPIHASLAEINRRLDTIEESYANLKGCHQKEIDEIRDEVRAIQKTPRHRKEDRCLITLVPSRRLCYTSRIR